MSRLGRAYKKNFDILESFLSELLKEDIKIEGLLESGSKQKEEDDKFNRVDLYAENSKSDMSNFEKIVLQHKAPFTPLSSSSTPPDNYSQSAP